MWCDPIVEEIHKIREEYAEQFGFDISAICKDIQEKQARSGHKLVSFPARKPKHLDSNRITRRSTGPQCRRHGHE